MVISVDCCVFTLVGVSRDERNILFGDSTGTTFYPTKNQQASASKLQVSGKIPGGLCPDRVDRGKCSAHDPNAMETVIVTMTMSCQLPLLVSGFRV